MPSPTLRDVHVDRALTEFSIAYRNESYIAEQVFPVLGVQKKSDFYYTFPKGAWYRDDVAIRAPGARSAEADYEVSTGSYVAMTYAISKVIPDEVRENADNPFRPDVEATEFVMDQLLRAQERRVAAITSNSTLWSYACSAGTSTWGVKASASPDVDIELAIDGVIGNTGRHPNVMVMSWPSFRALRSHPNLVNRVQYTRPGAMVQLSDIQTWFGIDKVLVSMATVNTGKQGATDVMSYIWSKYVWLGYVTPTPALMTPTAGYLLEWKSRQIKRFRRTEEYTDKIEATHSMATIVTAADAGAVIGPVTL